MHVYILTSSKNTPFKGNHSCFKLCLVENLKHAKVQVMDFDL